METGSRVASRHRRQRLLATDKNCVIYCSQSAIDILVEHPLSHACCHAKRDVMDQVRYKTFHHNLSSRFIFISSRDWTSNGDVIFGRSEKCGPVPAARGSDVSFRDKQG